MTRSHHNCDIFGTDNVRMAWELETLRKIKKNFPYEEANKQGLSNPHPGTGWDHEIIVALWNRMAVIKFSRYLVKLLFVRPSHTTIFQTNADLFK